MHRTLPVVVVEGLGFSGPLSHEQAIAEFAQWSGIYIVARAGDGITVDVGSATDIGNRLETHDRKACWNISRFSQGLVFYAHIERDELSRLAKEQFLRQQLNPLCGLR